jgi:hypothetical protein
LPKNIWVKKATNFFSQKNIIEFDKLLKKSGVNGQSSLRIEGRSASWKKNGTDTHGCSLCLIYNTQELIFKYERASYHALGHRGKLPREGGGGTIKFSKAHPLVHSRFRRQILPLFRPLRLQNSAFLKEVLVLREECAKELKC